MGHVYPSIERIGYMGLEDLDTGEQIACLAIMSRNWFFQMWVLQECVLSHRIGVLLGDLCFNFQLIYTLHMSSVYMVGITGSLYCLPRVAKISRFYIVCPIRKSFQLDTEARVHRQSPAKGC